MKEFRPAKKRVEVSVGESVRILRELQELSQSQLSELTGIPQATISAIENGRVNLGVERAKVFARALQCHPAVLVFPGWEVPLGSRRITKYGLLCGRERCGDWSHRHGKDAGGAATARIRFSSAERCAAALQRACEWAVVPHLRLGW
jgi:transcriptional regulator with XRE-family HTH domain